MVSVLRSEDDDSQLQLRAMLVSFTPDDAQLPGMVSAVPISRRTTVGHFLTTFLPGASVTVVVGGDQIVTKHTADSIEGHATPDVIEQLAAAG